MEEGQARDQDAVLRPSAVVINPVSYLGGHLKLGDERLRYLKIAVDEDGWTVTQSVQVDIWGRELRENRLCSIPWEAVRTVKLDCDGRDAPPRRFSAGGILAARRSTNMSLLIGTVDGEAIFEVHSRHPERIRAQLSPWTRWSPDQGSPAPAGPSTSAADSASGPATTADSAIRRLQELADLRDRGVLEPHEFERLKSLLLSELS